MTRREGRYPAEESTDLYPGLVVNDGRLGGAITVSSSRLDVATVVGMHINHGWDEVVHGWDYIETEYRWTAHDDSMFLDNLLSQCGEFARLLLVLADAQRCESKRSGWPGFWSDLPQSRRRVIDQLRRCLAVLEDEARPPVPISFEPDLDLLTTDERGGEEPYRP